jgi:nuclear cap-binding protein subunit 1
VFNYKTTNSASQLSWKLHVYVVLMGVINDRNYDLAREISKKLIESFESLFTLSAEHDQKKWPKIRCSLRFFGELSLTNFYASESIVNLLQSMSAESNNPNLAYAVMATLPWLASRLQEKHSDDLMKLVAGLEDFVNTLECPTVSLDMIEKPEFSANPLLQDCLVKVKGMRDGLGWQSELTQKPAIYDQFASVLEDQVSQEFNAAPNLDTMDEGKAILLRTPLYLFDADSSDEAFYPDKYSVDRWLLHELLWCTIAAFEINHRECVKTLFEKFTLPSSDDVGAKKYNLHRAIVETVMEDLFQVSGPSFKSVFHSVVLMGCCKASPTTVPKELGKIIYLVYDHCESMNFALLDRFTDWMSHHLSNFDFKWNWADW